ncbi:MAG: helix-turn-helix transcriptional regulator [Clostridia bacterium]|nr:helix-turn-helix transcriptional regulator [Clostridia bacterium]
MYFGERIRELRKLNNLTQEELGKKVFTGKNNISRYELGQSTPSYETLRLIALELDTTTDYLLGMPDAPVSRKVQTSTEFSKIIEITADFSKTETAKLLEYAEMLKKSR